MAQVFIFLISCFNFFGSWIFQLKGGGRVEKSEICWNGLVGLNVS